MGRTLAILTLALPFLVYAPSGNARRDAAVPVQTFQKCLAARVGDRSTIVASLKPALALITPRTRWTLVIAGPESGAAYLRSGRKIPVKTLTIYWMTDSKPMREQLIATVFVLATIADTKQFQIDDGLFSATGREARRYGRALLVENRLRRRTTPLLARKARLERCTSGVLR